MMPLSSHATTKYCRRSSGTNMTRSKRSATASDTRKAAVWDRSCPFLVHVKITTTFPTTPTTKVTAWVTMMGMNAVANKITNYSTLSYGSAPAAGSASVTGATTGHSFSHPLNIRFSSCPDNVMHATHANQMAATEPGKAHTVAEVGTRVSQRVGLKVLVPCSH